LHDVALVSGAKENIVPFWIHGTIVAFPSPIHKAPGLLGKEGKQDVLPLSPSQEAAVAIKAKERVGP
jgi:hypothetical protein